VWDALRDVGALHERLAPGFVVDPKLEPGARALTFGNGLVVRERSVALDEAERRLVRSAAGRRLAHHGGAAPVLPDEAAPASAASMSACIAAIPRTLEQAAGAEHAHAR
jgi:hypothetical protein